MSLGPANVNNNSNVISVSIQITSIAVFLLYYFKIEILMLFCYTPLAVQEDLPPQLLQRYCLHEDCFAAIDRETGPQVA